MTPFLPFSWKELLDLLVISFFLHRLYLLFRGTTALQVAIGVFFLWLLYFGAERAGLVVTTRFFQAMAAVSAVGLIVIFRREIREVLLHTNPIRFFLGQSTSPARVDTDEAASAVFRLAKSHTGALICFQKRDNVDEFVEGGTFLGARFGAALVESIFARESPLHDGAVIVQHGRIARAGGLLPLTATKNVPEKFGTRHRAALGLSECCDAVILVVSEERGEVSLVYRGNLETFAEASSLRRRLADLLDLPDPRRSRRSLSSEGLRQAGGLAVAFLMVTVLWNLYLGGGESMITVQVPVELRNVPERTEVSHDFDEHFIVRVSGKNPLIEALRPHQVSAFIDLGKLPAGEHTLMIGPENVRVPPGLRIAQVHPENVTIQMEPRIERDLPVEVVFYGKLPRGAAVETFATTPATIRVVGPRSRVEQMTNLPTAPIQLDTLQLKDRQEIVGELAPLPPWISLRDNTNREVRIALEMRP